MTAQDPIELLLPEADEGLHDLARRVTTLARLVVDDARPKLAQSERLDFASARDELEREQAESLAKAIESLVAQYLTHIVHGLESFFWFAPSEYGFQEGWAILLEARAEHGGLPGLPAPGESALAVSRRLCEALGELRAGPVASARRATWLAVIHSLEVGPVAGEEELRAVLTDLDAEVNGALSLEARLVGHIAECMLERGAVREALHWLRERRSLFCESARLEQLLEWCVQLTGVLEGGQLGLSAQSGASAKGTAATSLPARLRTLVEVKSERSSAGAASQVREGGVDGEKGEASLKRSDLGLACLAVFALASDGTATAIRVDAAPALKDQVEPWLKRRADACAIPEDPQQTLYVRAREAVCHHRKDVQRAALAREGALALALTPILDLAGEVAGWVHLECEHHLLPSPAVRMRLAESWRSEVLQGRASSALEEDFSQKVPLYAEGGSFSFEDERRPQSAEVFQRVVEELGLALTHRRVRGFDVEGSKLICVYEAGLALTSSEEGGGRALSRALQAGGAVLFEEPDARLSLHGRAGSGFVVPIRSGAKLMGLLSLESSRRRDLSERETTQAYSIANDHGIALSCAQFAHDHEQRHGFTPFLEAYRVDFRSFFLRAMRAAGSRESLVLVGPRGSGKRVLARLLASLAGCEEPCEWTVEARELERDFEGWVERLLALCGEVLVLDGVEDLEAVGQARLLRAIEQAGPSAPRLWTRLQKPIAELAREGRLSHELALRLGRLELVMPALAKRREEIPALADSLLAHLARAEGRQPPKIEDECAALLWRQPWKGNARELEAALARALHEAGESLLPEHFASNALFTRPLTRIPSRTPSREDLLSALWTTRKLNGRGNRRRAALYLGWDPETLARRCAEADLSIDTPTPPTPWTPDPT